MDWIGKAVSSVVYVDKNKMGHVNEGCQVRSKSLLLARNSDDESNSESENEDVDKENGSKPYNPYIEHFVKQAQANPSGNFIAL